MNQKHLLAYILFTGLSMAHAHCNRTILAGHHRSAISHHGAYTHAEFSPDGNIIAALEIKGRVMIWNAHDLRDTPHMVELTDPITSIAFAPSALAPNISFMAVGSKQGEVAILKYKSGERDFGFAKEIVRINHQEPGSLTSLALSLKKTSDIADDINLFIVYDETRLLHYNWVEKETHYIYSETFSISNIQCSPSGKFLYLTRNDAIQQLREENNFDYSSKDSGHLLKNISCTDFGKINENKFVAVSLDGIVRVRILGKLGFLDICNLEAVSAQFSPVDDNILLIARKSEKGDAIYLICLGYNDDKPYHIIDDLRDLEGRLSSARFNHNGTKVIATFDTGEVVIWDIPQSIRQTLYNLTGDIRKNYYCIVQ